MPFRLKRPRKIQLSWGESLLCHRGSMGLDGLCGKSIIREKAVQSTTSKQAAEVCTKYHYIAASCRESTRVPLKRD
jgi:hypothetical protein